MSEQSTLMHVDDYWGGRVATRQAIRIEAVIDNRTHEGCKRQLAYFKLKIYIKVVSSLFISN
jgi:hypothetical protein